LSKLVEMAVLGHAASGFGLIFLHDILEKPHSKIPASL
jgi:hypothetical protein